MPILLQDFLSDFPHVSVATIKDNDELLEYYHRTEIATKENTITYQRGDNFFDFLKERSEHFIIFTLRDDNKKLKGIGVLSFRSGFIGGKLTTVGYLGDLRVSLDRKLIREWRKFYSSLLAKSEQIEETKLCRFYQTAVIDSNSFSKNNLVESKIPNLLYKKMATYKMVNIIGRSRFNKKSEYNVRFAGHEDKDIIISFLQNDHEKRFFGYNWKEEFNHRINNWNNFTIANYIIVSDKNNKILAITSIWNPIKSKQVLISKLPFVLKIISTTGILAPFVKLKPLPRTNIPIEILYLNQISFLEVLNFDVKQTILKSIIDLVFKREFNMLAYCDFDNDGLLKNLNGVIKQKIPMALYSVHFIDNEKKIIKNDITLTPDFISPGFEMALV